MALQEIENIFRNHSTNVDRKMKKECEKRKHLWDEHNCVTIGAGLFSFNLFVLLLYCKRKMCMKSFYPSISSPLLSNKRFLRMMNDEMFLQFIFFLNFYLKKLRRYSIFLPAHQRQQHVLNSFVYILIAYANKLNELHPFIYFLFVCLWFELHCIISMFNYSNNFFFR